METKRTRTDAIVLALLTIFLVVLALLIAFHDPYAVDRNWEMDVTFPGVVDVETLHITGPIKRDSHGYSFTCIEHGPYRVDKNIVIAIRPAKWD